MQSAAVRQSAQLGMAAIGKNTCSEKKKKQNKQKNGAIIAQQMQGALLQLLNAAKFRVCSRLGWDGHRERAEQLFMFSLRQCDN